MNKLAEVPIGDTFFGGDNLKAGSYLQSVSNVGYFVSLFLRISFILAGLVLLFYFVLGGLGMISSAGKSDPKAAETAKATITSAIIGFVVVFTAYWIVKLIGKLLFGIDNLI
jgi:hypothetical protein